MLQINYEKSFSGGGLMQINIKNNISRKSMLFYTIIFVIVIGMTVGVSYVSSTRRLEEELTSTNIALLKQINENIDMRLRVIDKEALNLLQQTETRNFIDGIYVDPNEKNINNYNMMNRLANLLNSNENIFSIYLYSSVSNTILSDSNSDVTGRFFDTAWISDMNDMTSYSIWLKTRQIKNEVFIPQLTKNVVTLIRPYPISNSIGYKKGAIVVNVDENILYNVIKTARSKALDHIFIVDKNGEILSHDDKNQLYKNIAKESYMQEVFAKDLEGKTNKIVNGVNSSIFFITSPYNGWKYVSIVPKVIINKPLEAIRNILVVIALIMLVLGILAIIFVSNITYKPINRFIKSVAQNVKAYDEYGNINSSYDNLDTIEKVLGNVISKHEVMEKQIIDSIPVMRWRLFTDILLGTIKDKEDIITQLEHVNVKLYTGGFIVMIAEIDNKADILRDTNEQTLNLYKYALEKICDEFINQENLGIAIDNRNGTIAMIISFENLDATTNQLTVLSVAEQIKNFINQHFKITVTIGIGNQYGDLVALNKSYDEALEALKYKAIMGSNTIVSIEDINIHDEKQLYKVFSMIDVIVDTIKNTDKVEVEKSISKMFDEAVKKNMPPDIIRQLSMQLIMRAIKEISDIGVDMDKLLQVENSNVYEVLNEFEIIEQIKAYLEKMFYRFIDIIIEKRSLRSNKELMDKILKYINLNYMNYDLTLNSLADEFGLSVPYLSKIFKESFEANFTDYVIGIRMEKAKGLLCETDLKVGEITEKVGYANAHSFIRIFKKYTGMTPGEYRSSLIK